MKSHNLQFTRMNSDIADKFMPEGNYKLARNFRPNNLNKKGGFVMTNIQSNKIINNISFGQTVEYIGGCQDGKRNAIISFYKGSTINFITGYNINTQQEYFIAKWTKTNVSFNDRVIDADVMDDYLFWISDNKARKLNIVDAAAVAEPKLDVYSSEDTLIDKMPPLMPPTCDAITDSAFAGNNITNTVFQFAYAFEYTDGEISSYSPISKSVLPFSTSGLDVVFPHNAIEVTVSVGTASVKKIWLAYRKGQSRDWMLAEKLDKSKLTISGDTYTYTFYNDKYLSGLVQADVAINTNNPFYYFGSQAVSKDNFVMYGLVKDGLTKPTNVVLSLDYEITDAASRSASYKVGSIHEFGVVFRDENGRTDGVNAITSISIPFYTHPDIRSTVDGMTLPVASITWSVTGDAPSWAKTFSIVYLGNKTIASFVDYALTKIQDVGVYTYMDIQGLNLLKKEVSILDPRTPNSNLSPYTFTKGDRIRFRTDKSGTLLDATSNPFDYEILGYVSEVIDSSGHVLYPETIYTNAFNWNALNIGKDSIFEIYSPKKEFADEIFYEVGEVYTCTTGHIDTDSGTLTDGDVYVFLRNMTTYEVGELTADERKGIDPAYSYKGRVGFTPIMNVLKSAEGIQASSYSENKNEGSFYRNTSGSVKKLTITGDYTITTNSDLGYAFMILHKDAAGNDINKYIQYSVAALPENSQTTYHNGKINLSFTVGVNQQVAVYFQNAMNNNAHIVFYNGAPKINLSVKIEDPSSVVGNKFVESKDYSDYFSSDEHSFGRQYIEIPEENTTAKNNIVYTGKYFADTQIDETNKINPLNVVYIPYAYGWIKNMAVRGDTLKVFTENKELSLYLGKESYQNADATQAFIFSNTPIGNVKPYDSDFGISHRESLLQTNNAIYYYDRKNATIVASYENGQQDLGEASQKTYLREVTDRINQAISASKQNNVFIGYNDKNKEVFICFVIDGVQETIVFNELSKSFTHFLELEDANAHAPQGMAYFGENMLIYLQGRPYLNEQGTGYNTFFGDTKESYLEGVFNVEPTTTKILQAISHQGVGKYDVYFETDPSEEYPYGQYTKITKGRFQYKENLYTSDIPMSLKQKTNTINPLLYANGNPMRDRYATFKLINNDTTAVRLDLLSINYIDSAI